MALDDEAETDTSVDGDNTETSSHTWTTSDGETDEFASEHEERGIFLTECLEDEKFSAKGAKRHVRGAIKEISEAMVNETVHKRELRELRKSFKKTVEKPLKPSALERRPGPWRICEFFTMEVLLSMVATAMHWEACEPVSRTAGWDFETPDGRDNLRGYIGQTDP